MSECTPPPAADVVFNLLPRPRERNERRSFLSSLHAKQHCAVVDCTCTDDTIKIAIIIAHRVDGRTCPTRHRRYFSASSSTRYAYLYAHFSAANRTDRCKKSSDRINPTSHRTIIARRGDNPISQLTFYQLSKRLIFHLVNPVFIECYAQRFRTTAQALCTFPE